MVTLPPRYDLQEVTPGQWSVIDHWINDQYNPDGTVIETGLTEEQAQRRWQTLIDDDLPRLRAQLEHIYRRIGILPEVQ